MRAIALLFALLLLTKVAAAQRQTLREMIAQAHSDINLTVNVDGPLVSFDDVIQSADLIVRGVVGEAVTRLSRDERDLLTEYVLDRPQVLFSKNGAVDDNKPIAITLRGGTLVIDGYRVTVSQDDSPKLQPGMEVVALLRVLDQGDFITGGGIFSISHSQVTPLAPGEHRQYAGRDATSFVTELVSKRRQPAVK